MGLRFDKITGLSLKKDNDPNHENVQVLPEELNSEDDEDVLKMLIRGVGMTGRTHFAELEDPDERDSRLFGLAILSILNGKGGFLLLKSSYNPDISDEILTFYQYSFRFQLSCLRFPDASPIHPMPFPSRSELGLRSHPLSHSILTHP